MLNNQQLVNAPVTDDPWAEANNPTEPVYQNFLWGLATLNAKTVALVTGLGKVAYDPQTHGENKHTNVQMSVMALPEQGIENEWVTKRDALSWSKEWKTITLPSINALGITDARQLSDMWVKVESVPTGETYVKDGKEKKKTAFKFVQIFANEEACRADYLAYEAQNGGKKKNALKKVSDEILKELGFAPIAPQNSELKVLHAILSNLTRGKEGTAAWEALNGLSAFPAIAKYGKESPEVAQWMADNGFLAF